VSVISQPEFVVPIAKAVPGMVLSRNLEQNGQMLLRYGMELDRERIDKLAQLGVMQVYVHFSNTDLLLYKDLLISQDSPPSYERLLDLARTTMLSLVPGYARPEHCTRSPETAELVTEVLRHTFDVLFGSRRCFDLLRAADFFLHPALRHCPAAWVYAICVGCGLGYNLPTLLDLSLASLFYDIGMTKVPPRILAKPGQLTDLEYGEVKKHVFFGRRLLEDFTAFSKSAATVAYEHHEFYYGSGYPKGKRGDAIHEFSQIVGLTDKFAALLTRRTHRQPLQPYQAYELMLAQTRSSVSPRVFVAFLKTVLLYPRGSMLRLSTKEIAEPVDFPLHLPTRPTIRITHSPRGEEVVGQRRVLNLIDHPELTIESFGIADELDRGARPPLL
jgi:HD-GYP domain-containing protein (c-di-GMP phosphodiesterase class II)